MKRLAVWRDRRLLGHLTGSGSAIRFRYEAEVVEQFGIGRPIISMSLPMSTSAFSERQCRPFFDGLSRKVKHGASSRMTWELPRFRNGPYRDGNSVKRTDALRTMLVKPGGPWALQHASLR
jgi:HipA-like protein